MDSFDFDRLGKVALDQTLAYLNTYPEPQDHDFVLRADVQRRRPGGRLVGIAPGVGGWISARIQVSKKKVGRAPMSGGFRLLAGELHVTL
jgi:hypothetical protein